MFVTTAFADPCPADRPLRRRLAPALRGGRYDVVYEEFDGGLAVPREPGRRAIEWMLDG
jgi:hypothetical protein